MRSLRRPITRARTRGWGGIIPEPTQILLRTLVALGLGALVGLERQVAQEESKGEKDFPGMRTLAFLALLGALAVMLGRELHPWMAVALFGAAATFLVLRYRFDASERGDPGYTTEIASLCTFAVGALAQLGELWVATAITILMVALLRSKRVLHAAAEFLSSTDMEVLIRFLVIAGIIFPLLPDQAVDPFYGVVRPHDVWRMVVLISGLSFAGYVLMRIRAGHSGYLVTGLLSGLVSSTAATLAYSRVARSQGNTRQHESLIAFAASTSFVRMLVLLAVAAPATLPGLVLPLAAMSLTGLGLGFARHRPSALPSEVHDFANPLTLRVAVAFAAIYATVLLLLAFARDRFAEAGVYTLAAVAALGGADAPILSLARLTNEGYLSAGTASVGIAVVAIAATIGKLVILVVVGPGDLARRVGSTFLVVAGVGAATLGATLAF
ncbi:MAG: MgtC/SapB family protein [Myxococcota bacterium]